MLNDKTVYSRDLNPTSPNPRIGRFDRCSVSLIH